MKNRKTIWVQFLNNFIPDVFAILLTINVLSILFGGRQLGICLFYTKSKFDFRPCEFILSFVPCFDVCSYMDLNWLPKHAYIDMFRYVRGLSSVLCNMQVNINKFSTGVYFMLQSIRGVTDGTMCCILRTTVLRRLYTRYG